MGYVNMSRVGVKGDRFNWCYEAGYELDSPGNGDWILIPADVRELTFTISFSVAGTVRLETTNSNIVDVKEDNAIPVDSIYGEITGQLQDWMKRTTAARLVNVSGTARLDLGSS